MEPKVLVISNECFSKTSSNGRTLGNFFLGWPQDRLAQFYISSADPDFDYCKNYFRVTDRQALEAFKNGKCNGGVVTKRLESGIKVNSASKKKNRNSLTMLLRDSIWNSNRWKSCGFEQWVKGFNPDIVLLQAGDCAFMFHLALKVAKESHAKLVIYNSEGYYFKDFDYFRSKGFIKFCYPLFIRNLKRALEKAYKESEYIIYLCDELKNAYDQVFDIPSEVIYTASDMVVTSQATTDNGRFIVSYCGNLGIGRDSSLIEVANELQKISAELYLDVYGRLPNNEIGKKFEQCEGIHFHGLVSYDEVKKIISESDLIIHTESFDDFYLKDLKFAFSTKIADAVSSGKCFLLYAPEEYACSRYLKENQAAFVAVNRKELADILAEIINKPEVRSKYRENAINLSEKNHKSQRNTLRFQEILKNIGNVSG